MVDRHATDKLTPCTVVDLDGTLVNGNTLKKYLVCGLRYLLSEWKFFTIGRLVATVIGRKLRLYTHRQMKEVILSELFPYPEILERFNEKVIINFNPTVKDIISRNEKLGHRILLATAAPEFYIRSFWNGELVATEFQPGKKMTECVREVKATRVKEWLKLNSCRLDTVITDSYDDAELVCANTAGTNILVRPSKSTLRKFRKLKPSHLLLIK